MFIYSLSLHQDLYQKLIECLSTFLHLLLPIFKEEGLNPLVKDTVIHKNSKVSELERKADGSIEKLKSHRIKNKVIQL